jgi:hypothetical protein
MAPPAKEMLSSLLRPGRNMASRRVDSHLFSSSNPNTPSPHQADRVEYGDRRHATADFTEAEDEDDEEEEEGLDDEPSYFARMPRPPRDPIGRGNSSQVLPLFSASHLGTSTSVVTIASIGTFPEANYAARLASCLQCRARHPNHRPNANRN